MIVLFETKLELGTLAFSMSLTKAADDFIENKVALEERGKKYNHKPDWSPYYKYYEHEKQCVKGMIFFVLPKKHNKCLAFFLWRLFS